MIITLRCSFLIYGAGGDGLHTLRILSEAGARVVGFIDKRAGEMSDVRGWPVYSPEDAALLALKDAVVIITVKNVFSHDEIARALGGIGFGYIIYKPAAILKGGGSDAERRLSALHDTLIVRRKWFDEENIHLPELPPPSAAKFEDRLLIEKDNEEVTAWVPAELIFNYAGSEAFFSGCNLPLFFPLVGLYRGLLADHAAPEDWRDDFLVYSSGWLAENGIPLTPGQGESLLASRIAAFQEMARLFEIDLAFFSRNAPQAVMSKIGRFTLTSSGRNRIAFLLARGFRFIPLSMPLKDYAAWNAPDLTTPLRKYLQNNSAGRLFAPIPHPFFADVPADFIDYMRLFAVKIAYGLIRSYYRKHIISQNGLRLFDEASVRQAINSTGINCLLRDGGAAARYFAALGFPVTRCFDPNWPDEEELARHIDLLFTPATRSGVSRGDILLLDSSAAAGLAEPLIEAVGSIYFLQRADEELPYSVSSNFNEIGRLFDTLGRGGKIAGRIFTRRL